MNVCTHAMVRMVVYACLCECCGAYGGACMFVCMQTDRHRWIQSLIQTGKYTDRHASSQAGMDRQTGTCLDRHAGKHADRQAQTLHLPLPIRLGAAW